MAATKADFHIFREERRSAAAQSLVEDLRAEGAQVTRHTEDETINLLLLAAELETALIDSDPGSPAAMPAVASTDLFAAAAVGPRPACDLRTLAPSALQTIDSLSASARLSLKTPEGFAHYALHPLDYADLVSRVQFRSQTAFVVGLRTIGTTLSAVVTAELRQLGILAERITVRPQGHPYDRSCQFPDAQRQAIRRAMAEEAEFFVCDEGPGRSGSSLLSVAEALHREGVPSDQINILCSHQPDPANLCAAGATERWPRYRSYATGMTRRLPTRADKFVGGGAWRSEFLNASDEWPAVWPQMERLKYLSRDGRELLTFEGYGPYGNRVSRRNQLLAAADFGLPYLGHAGGFGRHVLPQGRPARLEDLSPARLRRMAEYCAWRPKHFSAAEADAGQLQNMVRVNFEREFGCSLNDFAMPLVRPAICDTRMAPHEWFLGADGGWRKLNAAIHGDDHFFPGPCDVAWDLAGIIVEWNLTSHAREFLLAAYLQLTGDDPRSRITNYELGYAVFRLAWSKMAAASVQDQDSDEAARLLKDYRRYRIFVETVLARPHANHRWRTDLTASAA